MKAGTSFEPHLIVHEMKLPPTAEWVPNFRSWSIIQVRTGIGYWQQANEMRELTSGSTLVMTGRAHGRMRASQLSEVAISYSCLEPDKLTGLLSLSEQHSLKKAANGNRPPLRMLHGDDPIAGRFMELCATQNGVSPSMRLQLLQIFIDLFKGEMVEEVVEDDGPDLDSRARLRQFLRETVGAEFTELSLSDLAPRMRCSTRHLSRLFRREMGMSFREKQTELRLNKACELLATSNAKVVDVAVTSGFQSNSLFSLMFKKHFGISPGKWREQNSRRTPRRQKFTRMLPA